MVKSEKQRKHLEKLSKIQRKWSHKNQNEKQKQHLRELNKKQKGEKHPSWKGGERKTGKMGYIRQWCRGHPYCDKQGYVLQHRLVMEKHIGRVLLPSEVVHHINGKNNDNRIENLMLFDSQSKHMISHKGTKKKYNTKKRIIRGEE